MMYYQAQENGINQSMFDYFSFGHLALGFIARKSNISLPVTFGIAMVWEFVEPFLKEKYEGYFPNSTRDSPQNKLGDVLAVLGGWLIGGVV